MGPVKGPVAAAAACPAVLAGCAALISSPELRIEDRPAQGVIRVYNASSSPARLHYVWIRGFGEQQMLALRYRDASARIIRLNGSEADGWWSIKGLHADLGGRIVRRPLTIPAGGSIDIRRDVAAIGGSPAALATVVAPCEIQFALEASLAPDGSRRVAVLSGWSPQPCPSSLR